MNFLRSRAEHLADHLRETIARGELTNPLPAIRVWSAGLGVGCGTLVGALKILRREGVVQSKPRKGVCLVRRPGSDARPRLDRLVRWIWPTVQSRHNPAINEVVGALLQKLSRHGIRLSTEMHTRPGCMRCFVEASAPMRC